MTSYSLLTSYAGQSLIEGFNFISSTDPSHGFVSYQNYSNAVAQDLVSVNDNNQVIIAADSVNKYNPNGNQGGRPSVRIESKDSYNQVLVIGDFAHMPGSTCGAWPAFWMYGPNWPSGGEIDIIEGANMAYQNLISAHTSSGCNLPSTGSWTGSQQEYADCSITDGCNYVPPSSDTSSYGDSFNAIGGGVYALLWTSDALQVWHFPRGSIPQDITSKSPVPASWGTPQALFGSSSCDVAEHFSDMSIVLNIDFCGDYAGNTWGTGSCSGYAPTCETWVGNNPDKLTDLYWEVNYIDVYSPTTKAEPISTSSIRRPPIPAQLSSLAARVSSSAAAANEPVRPTSTARGGNSAVFSQPAFIPSASGRPVASASSRGVRVPAPSASSPIAGSNPANVNNFAYLGCFSSTSGYSAFTLSGTDPNMSLEQCTNTCSGSKYAAVANTQCYCADTLDAGTSSVADRSSCNTPCPGNNAQYCGSSSASLRSLYINNNAVEATTPPPAPPMAGNATDNPVPSQGSADGAPPPQGPGSQGAGPGTTLTSTVIYATVCPTNPATLVTITTTVTYCPDDPTDPTVPQSTMTQSCNGCGINGQNEVTLTVPVALVSSPASVQPTAASLAGATTATGVATLSTPVAEPTYSGYVQVSAATMSERNIAMMVAVGMFVTMLMM